MIRDAELRNVAFDACQRWHAWQRVEELHGALTVVDGVFPDVIVEIGCGKGGTLWAWRSAFPTAAVYGVTIDPAGVENYGATVLIGDSRDRATLQRLKDQLGRRPVDVLFIDGDHTAAVARSDWDMYSPLVRSGGLVLFHDVAHPDVPQVAPVWEQVKREAVVDGRPTMEIVSKTRPAGFGIVRMSGVKA